LFSSDLVVHKRNFRVVYEQYLSIKKKNVFYMLNKQTDETNTETITFREDKYLLQHR